MPTISCLIPKPLNPDRLFRAWGRMGNQRPLWRKLNRRIRIHPLHHPVRIANVPRRKNEVMMGIPKVTNQMGVQDLRRGCRSDRELNPNHARSDPDEVDQLRNDDRNRNSLRLPARNWSAEESPPPGRGRSSCARMMSVSSPWYISKARLWTSPAGNAASRR